MDLFEKEEFIVDAAPSNIEAHSSSMAKARLLFLITMLILGGLKLWQISTEETVVQTSPVRSAAPPNRPVPTATIPAPTPIPELPPIPMAVPRITRSAPATAPMPVPPPPGMGQGAPAPIQQDTTVEAGIKPEAPAPREVKLESPLAEATTPHSEKVNLATSVPLIMKAVISLLTLVVGLIIIMSPKYPEGANKWAMGAVGLILGYWLK